MAAIELECLAVVKALNNFRPYVWGKHVTVITDATALLWLLTLQDNNGKLMRWALRIQEYDITVQHRPGVHNLNADALSRLPQQAELDAPRIYEHTDVDWPEALPAVDAPLSGVSFEENVPSVSSLNGYVVDNKFGTPFKLNDLITSIHAQRTHNISCAISAMTIESLADVDLSEDNTLDSTLDIDTSTTLSQYLSVHKSLLEYPTLSKEGGGSHAYGSSMTYNKTQPSRLGSIYNDLTSAAMTRGATKKLAETADRPQLPAAPQPVKSAQHTQPHQTIEDPPIPPEEQDEPANRASMPNEAPIPSPPAAKQTAKRKACEESKVTPCALKRKPFIKLQTQDCFCKAMIDHLVDAATLPDSDELAQQVIMTASDYNVEADGLLVHLAPSWPKRGRVLIQAVVPTVLRTLVLRLGHDDALAMHAGIAATHGRISERYFWPNMAADVRLYVNSCVVCQQIKPASNTKVPVTAVAPRRPWQRISLDLLDTHITTPRGNRYICAAVEDETGWPFLYAIPKKTDQCAAECLFDLILEAGAPEEIHSDQGPEFVNQTIKHLCKLFRANKVESSAYHPQANGRVEKMNSRIRQGLRAWINLRQNNWDEGLKLLTFAIRTTPRASTGLTPFFSVFCREAVLPNDAMMHHASERDMDLHESIEHKLDLMNIARQAVQEAFDVKQEAVSRFNANIKRSENIKPGCYVWVKTEPVLDRVHRLDAQFSGPWLVVCSLGDSGVTFLCKLFGKKIVYKPIHLERMKLFHNRPQSLQSSSQQPLLLSEDLDEMDASEASESLYDRRSKADDSAWEYRVRMRDGTLSPWLSETDTLKRFSPLAHDTFHALYELKHQDQMPRYAKRRSIVQSHKLTSQEALKQYPRGTKIARAGDLERGEPAYIKGEIRGYLSPWWRACYEDGEWEDLTKTQVLNGIQMFAIARIRVNENGLMADAQHLNDGKCPDDLGTAYIGRQMRLLLRTCWKKGTILREMHKKHFNFEVRFEGESGPRDVRLTHDNYSASANAAEGSWYLIQDDAPQQL